MHEQNTQSSFDFALPTMTPQSSRFGKDNLFFAVLPDRQALDQCLDLQAWLLREHLPFGSPRPPELLCVSLYSVDHRTRISDAVVSAACRAASAIDACQFELSFDHVAAFRTPQRNAIALGGNGGRELLRQLHVRIGIEMQDLGGDSRITRDFQPHVALLDDNETMPRVTLPAPVTIAAREFVLIRDRAGDGVCDYIDRWPLQASA
ncbi:2'-5' RNA ligase [Rhizobium sp. Root1203]|uniref:2'-5' RNA ligase family protein n=1 Tax=Rhizobium sp. Root1203 TaxID=1736427 RepID=UPI00070B0AB1|nr:hypothetical protein [Rhizobium sp. Root1203]KQV10552.1 2'-5' RNA ligase [Rhizobium sp. Root1203]